jgi:hypothetical protein
MQGVAHARRQTNRVVCIAYTTFSQAALCRPTTQHTCSHTLGSYDHVPKLTQTKPSIIDVLSFLCIRVELLFVSDHVEATHEPGSAPHNQRRQQLLQLSQVAMGPYEPGTSACAQYWPQSTTQLSPRCMKGHRAEYQSWPCVMQVSATLLRKDC